MVVTRSQSKKSTCSQRKVAITTSKVVAAPPKPIIECFSGQMHSKIVGNKYHHCNPETEHWQIAYDLLSLIFRYYIAPSLIIDLHHKLFRHVITKWCQQLPFVQGKTMFERLLGKSIRLIMQNVVNKNMHAKYQLQIGLDGVPKAFLEFTLSGNTPQLSKHTFSLASLHEILNGKRSSQYLLFESDIRTSPVIYFYFQKLV
ncbi:MAG: hypothetical protein AAF617_11115 [Bacteroidota bacterium]